MHQIITCNLTRADIIKAARESPNKKEAARRLGISKRYLQMAVNGTDLDIYFKGKTTGRPAELTKDDLLPYKDMLIKDVAECLGMSYSAVRRSINREGIRSEFPNRGKGSWISRRGYAG